MNRKYAILIFLLLTPICFVNALDLETPRLMNLSGDEAGAEAAYLNLLNSNPTTEEKSIIEWNLAEIYAMATDSFTKQKGMKNQEIYQLGLDYATASLKTKDSIEGHMWHATCLIKKAKSIGNLSALLSVDTVKKEYTAIVNSEKGENYPYAWHAIGELFLTLPTYSTSKAVSYLRKAISCIPSDELQLASFYFLAKSLLERNLSSEARISEQNKAQKNWNYAYNKSNYEKYAYYEGSLGPDFIVPWSSKPFSEMSDAEEAKSICEYAVKIYNSSALHSGSDTFNLGRINSLLESEF